MAKTKNRKIGQRKTRKTRKNGGGVIQDALRRILGKDSKKNVSKRALPKRTDNSFSVVNKNFEEYSSNPANQFKGDISMLSHAHAIPPVINPTKKRSPSSKKKSRR